MVNDRKKAHRFARGSRLLAPAILAALLIGPLGCKRKPPPPPQAKAEPVTWGALVGEIFDKGPYAHFAHHLVRNVNQNFFNGWEDDEKRTLTQATLSETLSVQRVSSEMRMRVLATEHDEDDQVLLIDVRDWYRTDLGKKIVALDKAYLDSAMYLVDPVEAENTRAAHTRRRHAQRLDASFQTAQMTLDMLTGALRGLSSGFQKIAPGKVYLAATDEERAHLFDRYQAQLIDPLRQAYLDMFLVAYGPLTDAELEAYVQFAKTRANLRFNAMVRDAVVQVAQEVGEEVGEKVAEQLVSAKR